MIRIKSTLLLLLALTSASSCLIAQTPTSAHDAELTAADQLYRSGKFAEAADKYQTLLKNDPKLVSAQVGLVRSLLKQQKLDEALARASGDLAAQPNSAPLLAAMGDVQFRLAQISEAEESYHKAIAIDSKQVRAHLGLSQVYRACSLDRHAYDELVIAHQIAPGDPEVQRWWFSLIPRKERIAAIEAYLAGPHPDDPEETAFWQQSLAYLKATVDKPIHACKLVSHVEQTSSKLESLVSGPNHDLVAYGLVAKLNDRNARLLLDTGASGIVVTRRVADKAGLTHVSDWGVTGVGDKGVQNASIAVADRIRIGELEFQDCIVRVSDRAGAADEDGFIGTDVFSAFLVDLDLAQQTLRLSPLPKRPDQAAAPASLDGEGEGRAGSEHKEVTAGGNKAQDKDAAAAKPTPPQSLPEDRYIAPEMQNWTQVFRFGHQMLIPTHINNSPSMLFLIDTGANVNVLSQRAAKQMTNTASDSSAHVQGLSGEVSKAYRADNATIQFGHYAPQKNQKAITLDLSNQSRRMGTEMSGMLGFELLRMFDVKIDYRDGLVDFSYDTKRFGKGQ